MTPLKSIFLTVAIAILAGSSALAATGGQIPLLPEDFLAEEPVNSDAYPDNHGQSVSEVARDKDAIGTWVNPNGKVIENHGKAVREAAHNKEHKDKSDRPEDDTSDDAGGPPEDGGTGDDTGAPHGSVESGGSGGNPPAHSNAGGNGGGMSKGGGKNK